MALINNQKTKRLWLRFSRRGHDALEFGQQADEQIEKLLLRRFDRLMSVKRFVLLWVLLFVAIGVAMLFQTRSLSSYYQALLPVPGGIYNEGAIGSFSNANPLYASTSVDNAVSHLVFSGLFKYDQNNQLMGDLAKDYAQGPAQTHYVVHLKHGVKWHDGQEVTADDVIFTYNTIKNIEAQSPLYNNWKDVSINKLDKYSVGFDLPNALAAFPQTMTNGIIPKHLLDKTDAPKLRTAPFNNQPIGSGPFVWRFVETSGTLGVDRQQHISLAAFNGYFEGRSKLDSFSVISFEDDQQALAAYKKKQVNALAGLETVPSDLAKDKSTNVTQTPLTTAVMAFFKNTSPILSDAKVRQAMVASVDRSRLDKVIGAPVKLVDGPLLRGQLGYNGTIVQMPFDLNHANQLLDEAGWAKGADGFRAKNGQSLTLTLRSQNTDLYTLVSQYLQNQWAKAGVKVNIQYHDAQDLQSNIIASHDYDILVYGINIGVDPDVFAYWDSSQASTSSQGHMNLSEYKSAIADQALESARTRSNSELRTAKYNPFLTAWVEDAPALGLFQPNYIYISRGPVFNYGSKQFNNPSDRYHNVNNWMIRQSRQNT